MQRSTLLLTYYRTMLDALGPSRWWPGETPFEVAVGAILTQNTNWGNVERAIDNLRRADALTPGAMRALSPSTLSELIRPAGYFRVKADRLGHFLAFLEHEAGPGEGPDLSGLAAQDPQTLREKLLQVKGVGPETADSILLYALDAPTFVVDASTRRSVSRHGLLPEDAPYEELREFFMDVLEPDTALYNEYHALIVRVGKHWCRKRAPLCDQCPLGPLKEDGLG